MSNIFAASEIVEMGIQIEKNGKDFYDTVAKSSTNNVAKEIFQFLSKEEENHIKAFESILSQVKKYEPPEAYTDDYFSYIKALAGDYVFVKKGMGKVIGGKVKTDKEAVDMGIGFERDSILFYHEMKKFVLEKEKETVERLLDEERKHLVRILGIKKSLQ
ncbi:MAG: ferritin family protein [Candidatus Omnitrophota bacterium]